MKLEQIAKKYAEDHKDISIEEAFIAGLNFYETYQDMLYKTRAEKLKAREKKFYESLVPFVPKYGRETIREFYDYWSEPDRAMYKMKFEKEDTWHTERRLDKWAKNNFNKKPKEVQTKTFKNV